MKCFESSVNIKYEQLFHSEKQLLPPSILKKIIILKALIFNVGVLKRYCR